MASGGRCGRCRVGKELLRVASAVGRAGGGGGDSSLTVNRTTKAGMSAGRHFRILDTQPGGRLLKVDRDPAMNPEQPLGRYFRSVLRLADGDGITPLATPQVAIEVSDLLP